MTALQIAWLITATPALLGGAICGLLAAIWIRTSLAGGLIMLACALALFALAVICGLEIQVHQ